MNSFRSILVLGVSTLLLFGVGYPLLMVGTGQLVPRAAAGLPIHRNDTLVGFENIGQAFSSPRYFHGRPSAVGYNGMGTGGSNLGASNPEFHRQIEDRIRVLLENNPGLHQEDIPAELITASGSGLDPHISTEGAMLQVGRIARARSLLETTVRALVVRETEGPLLGVFGPGNRVNVLRLNLALDDLENPGGETKEEQSVSE